MDLTLFGKFDRLLLEVELAPTSRADFDDRYKAITGENPVTSDYYKVQNNKWGLECRIYFDAPHWVAESLGTLGYTVESRPGGGYRSEYQFRVNSQNLFWQLVQHGYRLGPNAPIPS
ncbi:hypothetical protein [Fontivita pretiosa]|uniref:hypothetical protein n=1 Tax=Fontivita pretiosa TaxID=2989684 RepID=UPI003D16A23B